MAALSEEDIQGIVKFAVTEAIDFIESDIAPDRNRAQRYYDGKVDIGHEEGRSKVVATKVRDTVRSILPNVMRIFLASEHPAEFVARKPQDVMVAKQATEYLSMEFERLNGFSVLSDAILDALVKKNGFIKAYWDEAEEIDSHTFRNLTEEELTLLTSDTSIELEDVESAIETGPDGVPRETYTAKLSRTTTKGRMCIESIPPEDFFIDPAATCLDDAYVYGHQSEMRVCDLVEMGFEFDKVVKLKSIDGDSQMDEEKYERNDYATDKEGNKLDPSMRLVTVTEAYMKIDVDGNGKAKLQRFLLGGDKYEILEQEDWSGVCVAVFEQDPIPHSFFSNSIPDLMFEDQDSSTAMIRGVLDNVALTNSPRTEALDEYVNMDDLLNNEIGNVVRVTQTGAINPLLVPFIAGDTLGAIQYMDQQIEAKTGINSISAGLNPETMQNQTATAVSATVQAGTNTLESIARNLAQGYADLMRIMLKLLVENSDEEVLMRFSGDNFVPMDPRSWNTDLDIRINVGLGTGREAEKQAALMNLLQLQMQLGQAGSSLVQEAHLRNTVADMLAISGVRNVDRYMENVPMKDPQQMAQEAQQQQQQPDPATEAFKEVEGMKAQKKQETEMAKIEAGKVTDSMKMKMEAINNMREDDLARDQMVQDLFVDLASIMGQYGSTVDVAAVKQAQNAPRDQGSLQ